MLRGRANIVPKKVLDALRELGYDPEKIQDKIPKPQRDPSKVYKRKLGGGRRPLEARRVLGRILYVLRTGIQREALPKEYGVASAMYKYFIKWTEAEFEEYGAWELEEYDELKGIGWE